MTFTKEQLEYITDTTCKYGCAVGWSNKDNCLKCPSCGKKWKGEKPDLISIID